MSIKPTLKTSTFAIRTKDCAKTKNCKRPAFTPRLQRRVNSFEFEIPHHFRDSFHQKPPSFSLLYGIPYPKPPTLHLFLGTLHLFALTLHLKASTLNLLGATFHLFATKWQQKTPEVVFGVLRIKLLFLFLPVDVEIGYLNHRK